MLDFPQRTINYIKSLLVKQQQEVEKSLKEVKDDDPVNAPVLAESTEPGTDSYIADVHSKTLVLASQLKKTSENIKNALLKIRKGTYGKCEKCGQKIEAGRLFAMPTAKYCLSDSKKVSK